MRKAFHILLIFMTSAFAVFSSCKKPAVYHFQKLQLGTIINLTLISESAEIAQKTSRKVFDEIERIESLMSPYRKTSDVFRINNSAYKKPVHISGEVFALIEESVEISDLTDGCFDITFASGSRLWNFNNDSFIPPTPGQVRNYLSFINYKNIRLDSVNQSISWKDKEIKIGLGGIAKGYAIKRGIETARDAEIQGIILEAGGDLQVSGSKSGSPWLVGLTHPREKSILLTVALHDMDSIATSGDYERYAVYKNKRYHHIINPKTGYPAESFSSVSVITKDPVKSDGYATAFFVMGLEKAKELLRKDRQLLVIFVDLNMKIYASEVLKERIILMKDIPIGWL